MSILNRPSSVVLNLPEPPAVMVTVAKLVPAAVDALPADEYEARIARYQKLAEQNLPLPLFGEEQPPVPARVMEKTTETECWACGIIVPRAGFMSSSPESRTKPTGRPPLANPSPHALRQRKAHEAKKARERESRQAEAVKLRAQRFISRRLDSNTTETYCPKCFSIWGWPEQFEAVREAVEGVADIFADLYPAPSAAGLVPLRAAM